MVLDCLHGVGRTHQAKKDTAGEQDGNAPPGKLTGSCVSEFYRSVRINLYSLGHHKFFLLNEVYMDIIRIYWWKWETALFYVALQTGLTI